MKAIKSSEFKAKCLQLMNELAETGTPIIRLIGLRETPHWYPGKPSVEHEHYRIYRMATRDYLEHGSEDDSALRGIRS